MSQSVFSFSRSKGEFLIPHSEHREVFWPRWVCSAPSSSALCIWLLDWEYEKTQTSTIAKRDMKTPPFPALSFSGMTLLRTESNLWLLICRCYSLSPHRDKACISMLVLHINMYIIQCPRFRQNDSSRCSNRRGYVRQSPQINDASWNRLFPFLVSDFFPPLLYRELGPNRIPVAVCVGGQSGFLPRCQLLGFHWGMWVPSPGESSARSHPQPCRSQSPGMLRGKGHSPPESTAAQRTSFK